ncbi:MAG: hypothetical protein K1X51_11080 [Rhodospirillaceae bacterium]|nr:hypothetical protein [Rhodospirillaceae bacterium]
MSNILIYPRDRRADQPSAPHPAAHIDTYSDAPLPGAGLDAPLPGAGSDPLMGLGWLIAAVGLLCMLSAIALATLNLA